MLSTFPTKSTNKINRKNPEKLTKNGKTYDFVQELTEKTDNPRKICRKNRQPPKNLQKFLTLLIQTYNKFHTKLEKFTKKVYRDTEIEKHTKRVRKNGKKNGQKTCKKVPRNVSFSKFTTAEKFTHPKKFTTLKNLQKSVKKCPGMQVVQNLQRMRNLHIRKNLQR